VFRPFLAAQSKPVLSAVDPVHSTGWPQRLQVKSGPVMVSQADGLAEEPDAPEAGAASHALLHLIRVFRSCFDVHLAATIVN